MGTSISEVLAKIREDVSKLEPRKAIYNEEGYLTNPEPWGGSTVYPQPDVLPEIQYDWRDEDKS